MRTLLRVLLFCLSCAVILMAASRYAPRLPPHGTMIVVELVAGVATLALTVVFARWEGITLREVGVGWSIALIFALEHYVGGMTLWQSLWGPGVGSLVFGLAALRTRGLALSVGTHAGWDFTQWLLGSRDATGLWQPVVEKGFGRTADRAGIVGYMTAMMLTMLLLWWRDFTPRASRGHTFQGSQLR